MTHFTCSSCGLPVQVQNGSIFRSCSHAGSAVTANLDAVAYGDASLAMNPPSRVEKAVSRILEMLKIRRV